ncbi:hypothetical protein [Vibrio aestuarianus]|uniref:Flavodoxin n=1 Tax=Vibrio aestuarianus TaxID=28171 RepID=A0AAX3U893_9VIBR|nr:hypothetical protein [Vibrio aestuarianus]KOE81488.1 hypothetical protein ACS86_12860 [Vibrio alginolyticus]MDE1214564.1 hypothetical protein [Vibrio aestuarianus]MDE1218739.1 hypothetical protein [Vibrio aestuarianus]MDE1224857.1 hypothetical protein [Vibrio aestuarianus]MDE1254080.1 hypothetical protein [Vibrio aestuarianus]
MTNNLPNVAAIKNQWLFSQVDVEFPTQESLQGRSLYQEALVERSYRLLEASEKALDESLLDDVYLVDFHRQTIWFAVLQASLWANEEDKANIIEFFTQIIYAQPCELYLGFHQGEPVAAGLVTHSDDEILVSDLVMLDKHAFGNSVNFAALLLKKWSTDHELSNNVYIEQ